MVVFIVHRIDETRRSNVEQSTQIFCDMKNRLPLLLNTPQRTKVQTEAGEIMEIPAKRYSPLSGPILVRSCGTSTHSIQLLLDICKFRMYQLHSRSLYNLQNVNLAGNSQTSEYYIFS